MIDKDNLEMIVYLSGVAGLSASIGALAANIFNYYLISKGLKKIALDSRESAETIATKCLEEINGKSWFNQNYHSIGPRLAYERFLERNK